MKERRRRLRVWAAGTLTLMATGLVAAPGIVPTLASWTDREVVHGTLGVLDCTDPEGRFTSRGAGTMVSGSALGTDLDDVAAIKDAEVFNDGTRAFLSDGTDAPGPDDSHFSPLGVSVLQSPDLNLGFLQIPLDTDTGVLGQYAQARSTGHTAGAAGLVTDKGAVALDPGTGYPDLATIQLTDLLKRLDHNVASLIGENVNVSVEVGAVAGRATLDGCGAALAGAPDAAAALQEAVHREYLISSLNTVVDSPAVDSLTSGVEQVLVDLEYAVNGLASNDSVLGGLKDGVAGLLDGVLGSLRLGTISITKVTATIDLGPVRDFLKEEFRDEGRILTVSPKTGKVTVDTAALLAAAFPDRQSAGLNGLPPNTDLLGDPVVVATLTGALGQALDDWLSQVQNRLNAALDAVSVEVGISVAVRARVLLVWVDVAEITASVKGSLAGLTAGNAQVTTGVTALGVIDLGNLLDPLTNALVNGLGETVGTVLNTTLRPLATLGTTVTALAEPIVTAVSEVYNALYLDGLVSLRVNNQNRPFAGAEAGPPEWAALPTGRYDVSALRVGVLGAAGGAGVHLHLARGSVGPVCLIGATASSQACPGP